MPLPTRRPITVDGRFWMPEDSRLNPQPTTKGGSHDGGSLHPSVIVIPDAPGINEDTTAHVGSIPFEHAQTCVFPTLLHGICKRPFRQFLD